LPEAHIRVVNVTKRFGGSVTAVNGVSLDIPRGSLTTILGPSGCGKTTLLRMIAGFYDPDDGDLFIGPRRINDLPAHQRGTAMVFQDYALFPHMSVAENIGYGLKVGRVPRDESQRRINETMGLLGLVGLERRSTSQLSGGQQQRVALARALVTQPDVLLLDEPLSNLDAKLRVSIRDELALIQRQLNITTVYVTHDQEEALAMSDWIAVMNRGRVIQWGTPEEVYSRPRTPFMADFVGSVNLIPAIVVSVTSSTARVRIGNIEMELGLNGASLAEGESTLLSIRPETLSLMSAEKMEHGALVKFPGRVVRRTYLGHSMRYVVSSQGQDWTVDLSDPGATVARDGDVAIGVNPARVHIVPELD
jgi:ABC-type Fe3+/spermidine/putrescine transport system ATPase subunit